MSAVYWRTRDGSEATLRGPERGWCGAVSYHLTRAVVPIEYIGLEEHPLSRLVIEEHVRRAFTLGPMSRGFTDGDRDRLQSRESSLRLYLSHTGSNWHIKWCPTETSDPIKSNSWELALNTAIASGSPIYAFMTRLHAQCEIHMWVAEEDRHWLADLIERGLRDNVLRRTIRKDDDMGWGDVMALLRSDSPGPVVTDYSVTDSFACDPPEDWAPEHEGLDEDHRHEAWYALPEEERWDIAFEALGGMAGGLQVTPENLIEQGFGDGYSWYDVIASPSWMED